MINKTKDNNQLHKDHRQRMKESFLKSGFSSFSDVQKLEFILFFAISRKDTNPIAHRLLDEFGSFDKVLEAPISRLKLIDGIGEHAAVYLGLLLEIFSEYRKAKCRECIPSATEAKKYASCLYIGKDIEEFYLLCLDKGNNILERKLINSGTSSEVFVSFRKLTTSAMDSRCDRIILVHNHPNGNAIPSDEDIAFTVKVMVYFIVNDVEVIDHIIVTEKEQFSFAQSGLITELRKEAVKKIYLNFGTTVPNTLNRKYELK